MQVSALREHEIHFRKFPKRRFHSSFGSKVEYLIIPALKDYSKREHWENVRHDKPTLLFFNGWMLRFSQWGLQMPRSKGAEGFADYNLVFFNNLGHGKSEIDSFDHNLYLSRCAQAVLELADFLSLSALSTISHSMGSLVAMEFVRQFSGRVNSMAFISPVFSDPLDVSPLAPIVRPNLLHLEHLIASEYFASAVEQFSKFVLSDPLMRLWHMYFVSATGSRIDLKTFAKLLRKSLDINPLTVVTAFLAMIENGSLIGEHLREVEVPVLVVLGKKDFITGTRPTTARVKDLCPSATVVEIKKATHWLNSEQSVVVNSLLLDFMGRTASI